MLLKSVGWLSAWIEMVPEGEARGELAELYGRVRDPGSRGVDHVMGVHSLHPAGLAAHFELYACVMRSTATLRKVEREIIALVVSQLNGCHY